jgi:putative exporter of polyketide antibiotics
VHWLILVPYYFFLALTLLALLVVVCRLARVKANINTLVGVAIALGVAIPIGLLALDVIDLAHLKALPMLVLAAASMVLAGIDVVLSRLLPLPLDQDLQEL